MQMVRAVFPRLLVPDMATGILWWVFGHAVLRMVADDVHVVEDGVERAVKVPF